MVARAFCTSLSADLYWDGMGTTRNIDFLPVITGCIPFIQEINTLTDGKQTKEWHLDTSCPHHLNSTAQCANSQEVKIISDSFF